MRLQKGHLSDLFEKCIKMGCRTIDFKSNSAQPLFQPCSTDFIVENGAFLTLTYLNR